MTRPAHVQICEIVRALVAILALLSPVALAPEGQAAESAQASLRASVQRADAAEVAGNLRGAAEAMSSAVEFATRLPHDSALLRLTARRLALCRAVRDVHCESHALIDDGVANAEAGHTEFALAQFEAAATLSRQSGDAENALVARFNAVNARSELGDVDGALPEIRAIEADMHGIGSALALDLTMAELLIEANEPAAALQVIARVRDEAGKRNPGGLYYLAADPIVTADALTGRAYARLGRAAACEVAFRRALAGAKVGDDVFETNFAFAEALRDLGRPVAAIPVIARIESAALGGGTPRARRFHRLAAELYAAAGEARQAFAHERAAADLQTGLYRESLAEAVAYSTTAIALAERQAAADRLKKQNALDRLTARRTLERTRLLAVVVLAVLLVAGVGAGAVIRVRAREARQAEIAADRALIAAEIHDTLLQDFVGVAMQLHGISLAAEHEPGADLAGAVNLISTQAGAILAEARRTLCRIRTTAAPGPNDLTDAVAQSLAALLTRPDVALSFDADPDLPVIAPGPTEELRRVVGEAVVNALKHSGSHHIVVTLRARNAQIEASVWDDGRGFDIASLPVTRENWGLRVMYERMARAGGALDIHSAPGAGTTVTAYVPC